MGTGGYLILLFFMAAIALILSQWFRSSSDSPPSPAPKPKPPEPAPIFNQDAFNWKRRLPIIASVAALVVIVLVLSVVFSKGLTRSQAEEMLMSALTVSNASAQHEPEQLEKIEQKNGFEIKKMTKGSSGYTAQVAVYSPDLYGIAKALDTNTTWQGSANVQQALEHALDKAQPVQAQTTIVFAKTDEGYEPVLTTEFLDAYYGGVIRLYQDMLSEAALEMR